MSSIYSYSTPKTLFSTQYTSNIKHYSYPFISNIVSSYQYTQFSYIPITSHPSKIPTYKPSSPPYIKKIDFQTTFDFNSIDNSFLQNPLLTTAILETAAHYMNISSDYFMVSNNQITAQIQTKSHLRLQTTYHLALSFNISIPLTGIYAYYFNNPTLFYNLLVNLLKTSVATNNFMNYLSTAQTLLTTLLQSNPSLLQLTKAEVTPMTIQYMSISSDAPSELPSSLSPSEVPSSQPTGYPSNIPSILPTMIPLSMPSSRPSLHPSTVPTFIPIDTATTMPTFSPTNISSNTPSWAPSAPATTVPSSLIPTYLSTVNNTINTTKNNFITIYPSFYLSMRPTSHIDCGYPCNKNISVTLFPSISSQSLSKEQSLSENTIIAISIVLLCIIIVTALIYTNKCLNKPKILTLPMQKKEDVESNGYSRILPDEHEYS